jgi:alpha-tubulin suppressor-like RCC1 family protein
VKRATSLFLLLLLVSIVVALAVWALIRPEPKTPFGVGPKVVTATTQPSLTIGQNFAAMVGPDGSLWLWGDTTAIGAVNFPVRRSMVPQRLGTETDWKQVAAGYYGLLALKKDGSLWAIGSNTEGLLGLPNQGTISTLTRVGTDNDWREIKAGVAHCMARRADGSIWAFGQNNYGQIGVGAVSPRSPLAKIGTETNWTMISPGAFQSYALRSDGSIWAWGQDFDTAKVNPSPAQVGTETNWISISSGEYHLAALASDGSVWVIGANASVIEPNASRTNWVRVSGATNVAEIMSGENYLLYKQQDGTWSGAGSLGNFHAKKSWPFPERFDPLALHTQRGTTLMLMKDGRLWTLGRRLGSDRPVTLAEKITIVVKRLITRTPVSSSEALIDQEPFLIWKP